MDVDPVVVGPHQTEAQTVVVGRRHERILQRSLEERAVIIVIPIENEGIDPVVGRGIDLARHDGRIGFILVAPERDLGLLVPGKTGPGGFDQFPFGPAATFERRVARIAGVVVAEVVARHRDIVAAGRSGAMTVSKHRSTTVAGQRKKSGMIPPKLSTIPPISASLAGSC